MFSVQQINPSLPKEGTDELIKETLDIVDKYRLNIYELVGLFEEIFHIISHRPTCPEKNL